MLHSHHIPQSHCLVHYQINIIQAQLSNDKYSITIYLLQNNFSQPIEKRTHFIMKHMCYHFYMWPFTFESVNCQN